MLRLRRENGGNEWVQRFFHERATCPESKPMTRDGALAQGWNWMLAASVAAQKDLSPLVCGEWKLPLTEGTRTALGKVNWKRDGLTVKDVISTVTPVWLTPPAAR